MFPAHRKSVSNPRSVTALSIRGGRVSGRLTAGMLRSARRLLRFRGKLLSISRGSEKAASQPTRANHALVQDYSAAGGLWSALDITPEDDLSQRLRELASDGVHRFSTNTLAPHRAAVQAAAARMHQRAAYPLLDGTPFTLEGALMASTQARVVTEAQHPFKVVSVNKAWEELCGYTAEEVVGKLGLSFIQGPATSPKALAAISEAVKKHERLQIQLYNYKKDGSKFLNFLQLSPLTGGAGDVSHLLGVLTEVRT